MLFKAKNYTLVNGIGSGSTELNAFDNALQSANVGNFNLIKVSSILPPGAIQQETIKENYGSVLPIAYSCILGKNEGDSIVAAVAVGIPQDKNMVGVIMEHSAIGDPHIIENEVKQMVCEAMRNRSIEIREIKCSVSSCVVEGNIMCAFSGIALW